MFGGAKRARRENHQIINTCSAERTCISPTKFIMYNGEHSFVFVVPYSLSNLYTLNMWLLYYRVLVNVTVILESINLSLSVSQRVGAFAPNAPPFIFDYMNTVICTVSCSFCCLFSFLHYYFRGARQGLGGAKPLFALPQKCLWGSPAAILLNYHLTLIIT